MQYPSIQVSKYLIPVAILALTSISSVASAGVVESFASAFTTTIPFGNSAIDYTNGVKYDSGADYGPYIRYSNSSTSGSSVSADVQGFRGDNYNSSTESYTGYSNGSAFASADLSSGELKSSATLSVLNRQPDPRWGTAADLVGGIASIKDKFTTYQNGSPFVQTGNNQAKFVFDITGSNYLSSNSLKQTEFDPSFFATVLQLTFYQNGVYQSQVEWLLSDIPTALSQKPTDPTTAIFGNNPNLIIPTDKSHIEYSFNTGGDFEWELTLRSDIRFATDVTNGYGNLDYSHTVKTSYIAPEGTTTVSESGLFPNTLATAPVPETDSYAMLLAGLGVLGFVARRKTIA